MKKKYEILFLLIGLAAIVIMIANIGIEEIIRNIRMTAWWFLAIIAVRCLVYPLNTLSWQQVILPEKGDRSRISFSHLLNITISGYAINYITPVMALGGEPYRILRLKDYIGTRRATSSVLMYAIMHILSHFVFWIIGFVLILIYPSTTRTIKIISVVFIILCALAAFFIAKFYKKGVVVNFFNLLCKVPYLNRWMKKKMTPNFCESIAEVDERVRDLYLNHKRRFFASLCLETLSRIVGCLEILFIMQAIGIEIGLVEAIVISTGTSLFANLIFFSPMQLGTKEGGLILALKSIGLPSRHGVYIGLAMRISELFWIIVGIVLIKLYRYKPKEVTQ